VLFNSYEFILVFLPFVACIFFLLGRKGFYNTAIFWLVCASLFFYGWWEPKYVILILFSITVNFLLGTSLQKNFNVSKSVLKRKLLLVAGIIFNLSLLGYFKYANFFVSSASQILGEDYHLATIVLPLAISFFTFQQIAFLADAHKGAIKDLSLLHYCLFVTFFPQLIAGPIVHHSYVLPQFARAENFSPKARNLVLGLSIFSLGLMKKVLFADSVAVYATPVFSAAEAGASLTFMNAWLGAVAYTTQIYFDFSGYSDMAIGLSRMFGISLPLNFSSPYKSRNIIEFWRRWHITLSQFLRDYLYYPLGGNRRGPVRRYVNLMVVMTLGGLWHGAGWTFFIWGALHGFYLLVNHGWRAFRGDRRSDSALAHLASGALTFIAVAVALVPFRSETFGGAARIVQAMAGFNNFGLNVALSKSAEGFLTVIALLLVIWLVPNTQEIMRNFMDPSFYSIITPRGLFRRLVWRPNLAWAIVISTIFVWVIMILGRPTEFLYFQF
jgi:alginate O-acetyltransferase complex protein AlgI